MILILSNKYLPLIENIDRQNFKGISMSQNVHNSYSVFLRVHPLLFSLDLFEILLSFSNIRLCKGTASGVITPDDNKHITVSLQSRWPKGKTIPRPSILSCPPCQMLLHPSLERFQIVVEREHTLGDQSTVY